MTPAEAVECARLITDLWPHPPTTDVRLTLLASALEAIPSRADAARAINDLFYTERFQPTPAEIIERALGLSGIMDSEWRSILARLAGSEVTPSQGAIAALRAAGSSLSGLRGATEQHMDTVHRRWEAERRFALLAVARRSSGKELTRAQG